MRSISGRRRRYGRSSGWAEGVWLHEMHGGEGGVVGSCHATRVDCGCDPIMSAGGGGTALGHLRADTRSFAG